MWLLFLFLIAGGQQLQAQQEPYRIEILQGDTVLKLADSGINDIKLRREPFRFRFYLLNDSSIFFIASRSSRYFKTNKDSVFPDCMMFCGGSVGAARRFNPEQEICIYSFSEGISLWYYDSATDHRFDGPVKSDISGRYVERTITNLYDYHGGKKLMPIKNLGNGQFFYMVFLDIEREPCQHCPHHGNLPWRRYLKITFRD